LDEKNIVVVLFQYSTIDTMHPFKIQLNRAFEHEIRIYLLNMLCLEGLFLPRLYLEMSSSTGIFKLSQYSVHSELFVRDGIGLIEHKSRIFCQN
jgi:hypothetical protein